jgi:hypothetical protein
MHPHSATYCYTSSLHWLVRCEAVRNVVVVVVDRDVVVVEVGGEQVHSARRRHGRFGIACLKAKKGSADE